MKEGEEEKTKTYSALIWTNKAIRKEDIEFLNDMKVAKYPDSPCFIFLLPITESFVFSFVYPQIIEHGHWGL